MRAIAVTRASDESVMHRLGTRDKTALTDLLERCSSMMYGACPKCGDYYRQL